jgi:hypothetical protein
MKIQLITAVSVFCAVTALADKVTLKSGSFLTGKAGLVQDGKLAFTSDDLGEVKIDVANISQLDVSRENVVQYKDNSKESKLLSVKGGAIVDDKGAALDMTNVKALNPAEETWHGSVNVA